MNLSTDAQIWILAAVAISVLVVLMHYQRRRAKTAHWAVYLLDENTDRYGSPIADNLTRWEANKFALDRAREAFPEGYTDDGLGYTRAGRPGTVSRNVLIWDMNWTRDGNPVEDVRQNIKRDRYVKP